MAAEKKKKQQQQQQHHHHHHSHRPTQKQQNKPFKSRYATKAELKDRAKGKVERVSLKSAKARHAATKADRRNAARLEQKKKRDELVKANRVFDGRRGAPKIIAVVPLCPDVSPSAVIESAFRSVGAEASVAASSSCHFTLTTDSLKLRLQFLRPTLGGDAATRDADLTAVLDAVKVADFVMFVASAKEEVDEAGLRALSAIMAQGVPGVFTAVQHLGEVPQKKQNGVRKSLVSFISHFFPEEEKVHSADAEADMLALVRLVAGQTPKTVTWREPRAYMLVEEASFVPNTGDVSRGTLRVTGYVRGRNFDSSRLVHLQDFGDFQVAQITSAHADNAATVPRADGEVAMEIGDVERVLDVPDPEDQDDLVSENVPDPLANEQTWPTEDEIAEGDLRMEKLEDERKARRVRVPKGTSSYQAAWAVIDDPDGGSEDGTEGDDEDDDDEAMLDDGEGSDEEHGSGEQARSGFEIEEEEEYEDVEVESRTATSYARTEEISPEEEEMQMCEFMAARRKAHKDEMAFPDEIDTPMSTPARIRFQRYRGLQSFRTSPWDPYENLPLDYSRIFQFANFRRFRDRALRSGSDKGVPPGTRVHVYVRDVPGAFMATYSPSRVYPLFQLKRHEHKMSVLNFSIVRPSPDDDDGDAGEPDIIKSKDPLVLHCGFRRYRVHPIFSANTRHSSTTESEGRANKFERFLKPGAAAIATVFAPVQLTPAPVALYLEKAGSVPKLVATGTFLDVEPRRIVAKRVVLTGAPFKVHKRTCTVRYMFFNPDDVLWFKPVQVHTKHGRVGHIRESLGTHGYMKCLFDGPVTQQDVVCMNLYKRVFPKWNTTLWRRPDVEQALRSEGPDCGVQF